MRQIIGLVFLIGLCGGCAAYVEPVGPAGIYVPPPTIYVEPAHPHYWYHYNWDRRYWRR